MSDNTSDTKLAADVTAAGVVPSSRYIKWCWSHWY